MIDWNRLPRRRVLATALEALTPGVGAAAVERSLGQLLEIGRVPLSSARREIERWRLTLGTEQSAALEALRAVEPPRSPAGWLEPEEIEELLSGWESSPRGRHLLWCLLVAAGAGPRLTWYAVRHWEPASGVLPSGQLLPDDAGLPSEPPAPAAVPHLDREDPTARRLFETALGRLLADQPLHWALLQRTQVRQDPTVETMAIGVTEDRRLALFYAPTFVRELTGEECCAVLCHEVHHAILGHLAPESLLGPRLAPSLADPVHRRAWELACEVTANEFVPYALPHGAITLERLDLPPEEGVVTRYRQLRRRPATVARVHETRQGSPRLIPGVLARDPGNPDDGWADLTARPPRRAVQSAVEDLVAAGVTVDVPSVWRRALAKAGVDEARLVQAGAAHIDWRGWLRRELAGAARRQPTHRAPNRRQPDRVGVVPGRRRQARHPTVLVAIDTSGSVGSEELARILLELESVRRSGARVALVECDATVRRHQWLTPGDAVTTLRGRGETSLKPPFDGALLNRYAPDVLVYFTDGHGDAPEARPAGVRVLWALVGAGARRPAPWGEVAWVG